MITIRFFAPALGLCLLVAGFQGAGLMARAERLVADGHLLPFGEAGKLKMLYDARQRPQSVYLNGRVFIVYNGNAKATADSKGSAHAMLISYDPVGRSFSSASSLGSTGTDHHFCPIIWADEKDHLHVLYGCHKTPGTHLVSDEPVMGPQKEIRWRTAPQLAPKLSYPTVFQISGGRELVYYRTGGHVSSWTYRISDDDGKTWEGPAQAVTDLDLGGRLDWSSYQTKLPSRDGRHLHVVFTDYDDNKHSPDPKRFYNPRYRMTVSNEWKYNLSYVRVDLQSGAVSNFSGEILKTPVDIAVVEEKCRVWDTEWRGAGVPPVVCLDANGDPAFLHVLSGDDLESHQYYYVHRRNGAWVQSPICSSSHQWNSGHLSHDSEGLVHAYLVAGEDYLEGGYMDRHGGGRIEEWVSSDGGLTWSKKQILSPVGGKYAGWRFNNVQAIVRPDGAEYEGMLMFYGWGDAELPRGQAFLLHEE